MIRILMLGCLLNASLLADQEKILVFENIGGFVQGTIVHTFTGPDTIQNIHVNDRLLSFDLKTGNIVHSRVLDVHQVQVDELAKVTIEGEIFYLNPKHRFYVANIEDWVAAKDLKPNFHILFSKEGKHLVVDTVKIIRGRSYVYDLTLEDTHNYFVGKNKVLVHNIVILAAVFSYIGTGITITAATLAVAATIGALIHAGLSRYSHGGDYFVTDRSWQPKDRVDGDRVTADYPIDTHIRNQANTPYQPPQRPEASKDDIARWATDLGYNTRVSADKLPFDSHKQPGYKKDDRNYITYDIDGHKRGALFKHFWKEGSKWLRETIDKNGNPIGK
ncbi:MAG: polymorphic toxin-type HINT domain-containing protein [Myxococcaceae bacterium]